VVIAAVEAVGVALTAIATAASGLRAGDELAFVVSGAVVYALFAAGLAAMLAGLARRRSWSRGPFVVVQMLTLVVAWDLAQQAAPMRWVGGGLAVLAAGGLVLGLHPATRAALR
jgi:hypothetical protein